MFLVVQIVYYALPGVDSGEVNRVASHPPSFWLLFFLKFICFLVYFYFYWNRDCLPDVNIFMNAKHLNKVKMVAETIWTFVSVYSSILSIHAP